MIHAAQFETMNVLLIFLTENCCGGAQRRHVGPRHAVDQPQHLLSAAKDETARNLLQTPGIALCKFPIE